MRDYTDVPDYVRKFLMYIVTIRGKSEITADEYYLDIRTFLKFMAVHKGIVPSGTEFDTVCVENLSLDFLQSITLSDLYEYMYYVNKERSNGAATRSRKVSSLRSFYKYLTKKAGLLAEDPTIELETPKIRRTLPKYLSLEESITLLDHVEGPYRERDYCILVLFLNCGMRLSELVGINLEHLDLAEKTLVVLGKGNKERLLYLNDACMDAIRAYLPVRPAPKAKDRQALFLSRRNQRISVKTVQWIVKRALGCAGLADKQYSVHKLRHTAATLMYQHGNIDIRVLKEILGHENLGTTEIYTHLSSKQMKEASGANPLANIKTRGKTKPGS